MKGWPFWALFFRSKEQADLLLPLLEGQLEIWLILFFSAQLSQGMRGPVAEIAEDCAAPGIFHYVWRLILVNAKN